VVVCGVPSHLTTEHGKKELPFTVSVNVGEPAGTEVAVPTGGVIRAKLCEIEEMTGGGRLPGVVMVNGTVVDGPDALETETPAVPGNAVSVGKIEAVSCVEFTKFVTRAKPFQYTTDAFVKF